jgi:ATP-dependent RNA helicase DDX52/ROK1
MAYSKFDVIVSTPMRIVALLRASAIDLRHVETIVLDEADKLFEMDSHLAPRGPDEEEENQADEQEESQEVNSRSSFLSQVDEIIAACSQGVVSSNSSDSKKTSQEEEGAPSGKQLQRALFSATIGPFVQELADSFLQNPIRVLIGQENSGAPSIHQRLIFAGREDGKIIALRNLIQEGKLTPPALLFTQSIERSKELYRELAFDGINVEVMHSDRTASQREMIINRFRVGDIWILICTDLMARGIDFKAVKMIINYDLPQSAVSYIHRIGRTGRGGREGEAITFFTEDDIPNMRSIVNVMKLSGSEVPSWLLAVKQVCPLSSAALPWSHFPSSYLLPLPSLLCR